MDIENLHKYLFVKYVNMNIIKQIIYEYNTNIINMNKKLNLKIKIYSIGLLIRVLVLIWFISFIWLNNSMNVLEILILVLIGNI